MSDKVRARLCKRCVDLADLKRIALSWFYPALDASYKKSRSEELWSEEKLLRDIIIRLKSESCACEWQLRLPPTTNRGVGN